VFATAKDFSATLSPTRGKGVGYASREMTKGVGKASRRMTVYETRLAFRKKGIKKAAYFIL
jgi:hypothetical protein